VGLFEACALSVCILGFCYVVGGGDACRCTVLVCVLGRTVSGCCMMLVC